MCLRSLFVKSTFLIVLEKVVLHVLQYAGARKCLPSVDKCKHEILKLLLARAYSLSAACPHFFPFFGIMLMKKKKRKKTRII